MFVLEEKIYFWLLALIPILIMVFLLNMWWRKRKQNLFAEKQFLQKLSPDKSVIKPTIKLILWCFIFGAIAFALVNLKIGSKTETIKREGVDIVFAMDVSKSMLAEDIAPNRLDKSKQIVNQIINNLASDRIGIIAYAGSAFPQLPITTDYSSAKLFLQALNTNMVSSQGTAIGEAIQLAQSYYPENSKTSKVLIILSDGENHDHQITEILADAKENDLTIITIGVGTLKGSTIPLKENGRVKQYKKDKNGETVITRLDPSTLKQIAAATNGTYIDGTNTQQVITQVSEALSKIEKTEFETKQFASYKDQFQWFVGLALLLVILELLMFDKKTAWVKRLNLFNDKDNRHDNK
ncbi:VWA domain-containing protein [Mesonia sp. HuA40]|uniref:vWA domain-containing protein n=1 Tax=Mesonia sp. HuA40 TaxID=2602761 RepID=UPI0011C948C5|nr:VWA domain-containing protein [Mesonia sp. HuA40]TXK72516.1 VWA domain-containing protein [Mesonia sp. HuA40]